MTAYQNFSQDFPRRCIELLEKAANHDDFDERRVTWLLMAAASAFVMPFERLKLTPDGDALHPFGQNEQLYKLAATLERTMKEHFIKSAFSSSLNPSWMIKKKIPDVSGDVDGWLPDANVKPIAHDKRVSSIFKHLRNALAHGNVHAKGSPKISHLVFVQSHFSGPDSPTDSFDVLVTTVDDFEFLLKKWLKYLAHENVWELRLVA